MALRTLVKVENVSDLHDARYCAGMGVDWLGAELNPKASDFISAEKCQEIHGWLSGIQWVGNLGNAMPEVDIKQYPLSYLQCTDANLAESLQIYQLPLILKINMQQYQPDALYTLLKENELYFEYFVLENTNNLLTNIEVQQISDLCKDYAILVENRFDNIKLNELLDVINPTGIVLQGSEEEKVGMNNFDQVADLLESIEID
ncbi:MAG: hypothetical protein JJT94_15230 [Bernardetiaceae bacterium]|nr:hypothetical protein [Bernardetiaceae bacterium]